ncbi:hypothetical protein MMC12_001504 [Toensbergia leucococca]|nr:hypothetical protein [Toensbergia leucococca]
MLPQSLLPTTLALALLALLHPLHAHSDHSQHPLSDTTDWATRHMAEEHHITTFTPDAFFSLHDFDSSGAWTPDEIRRTYGLLDDEEESTTREISEERKEEVVREVLGVWDANGDGVVGRGEWMVGWEAGKRLKDFGFGPGHHGDDEYEYEIHHFEIFHGQDPAISTSTPLSTSLADWQTITKPPPTPTTDTTEEDLTHPEDIAHFAKHDREADAADRQDELDRMPIVEQNIPPKFRRGAA